jgi:hypothetical protein
MRELTVDGARWTVWEVHPASPENRGGISVRDAFTDGWLAVQASGQKRRISPIPGEWQSWTEERLADEVRAAQPVEARP